MCLRIQFYIYQWVQTFNFLKKNQNCCSLFYGQHLCRGQWTTRTAYLSFIEWHWKLFMNILMHNFEIWVVNFIPQSGTKNLATAPNVVFHYFLYFSSPFANFSKGLEIRHSLSPATLFSGASLPNHTKMFELVHLVTSMEDFGCGSPPAVWQPACVVAETWPSTRSSMNSTCGGWWWSDQAGSRIWQPRSTVDRYMMMTGWVSHVSNPSKQEDFILQWTLANVFTDTWNQAG
jgi:hypothetical protein